MNTVTVYICCFEFMFTNHESWWQNELREMLVFETAMMQLAIE